MLTKFCDRRRWRSSSSERKLPPSKLSLLYLRTTATPSKPASLLRPGVKTLNPNTTGSLLPVQRKAEVGHSGEGPFGRLLRSRLVSTISFSGLARMDYSLLGSNVLKDHSHPRNRKEKARGPIHLGRRTAGAAAPHGPSSNSKETGHVLLCSSFSARLENGW